MRAVGCPSTSPLANVPVACECDAQVSDLSDDEVLARF
jgi:hypothetical protein